MSEELQRTEKRRNAASDESNEMDVSDPQRHSKYWLDGEYVIFEVEKTLFRVPNHQFISKSEVFRDMFNLPEPTDTTPVEGRNVNNPIVLGSILADDFGNFLKAICPLIAHENISKGLSKDELISILKLSTMWYFTDFRVEAIASLSSMLEPAEKIAIGKTYKISKFITDGILALIKREEHISDSEAILMGTLTAVAIMRIRELYRVNNPPPRPKTWASFSVVAEIESKFGDELKSIKLDEAGYSLA